MLEDNIEGTNPQPEPEEEKGSYVEIIKKQKEMLDNSVAKEKYKELEEENAQLKDIVINGGALPQGEEEMEEVDIDKLAKHIFSEDNQDSNLEYIENALKFRKAILERDGTDVFAPQYGKTNANEISDSDFETAEKVANALQQCVDESGGDPGVFTAKLQSIIADDSAVKTALQRKRR